jgi:hypothetical protein
MRITQRQLRQIIKEELVREFYDGSGDDRWEDEPSGPSGDQYELMTSLNMKSVALSMINSWGSEDILVMVDILTSDDPVLGQDPMGEEDDLDRAQALFDDLLSPFGLTIDPEDRRLTPREKRWFGKLLNTITRLATAMNQL